MDEIKLDLLITDMRRFFDKHYISWNVDSISFEGIQRELRELIIDFVENIKNTLIEEADMEQSKDLEHELDDCERV